MQCQIIFSDDFKTGEIYDFSRVEEKLELLPDGKLKEKLISDFKRCQRTLMRIMRNTAQKLNQDISPDQKTFKEKYTLYIGPDGLNSLSFGFGFTYFDGKQDHRDLNGGVIFHGAYKLFNDDLTVKTDFNPEDDSLASISIHT
jgi:hypothetical protein